MHRDRRERIEQIQWERKDPRIPAPEPPRGPFEHERRRNGYEYDERIYEREVVYDDGSRRRYRIPPP